MLKAFEIAGYTKEDIESKFPALFNAFHYGAPPMLVWLQELIEWLCFTEQESIREVIAFPMNSNAQMYYLVLLARFRDATT